MKLAIAWVLVVISGVVWMHIGQKSGDQYVWSFVAGLISLAAIVFAVAWGMEYGK